MVQTVSCITVFIKVFELDATETLAETTVKSFALMAKSVSLKPYILHYVFFIKDSSKAL